MIKELRKLENKTQSNTIRTLQYRGKLGVYFSDKGYVSYDTDEFREYRKRVKRGRPYGTKKNK